MHQPQFFRKSVWHKQYKFFLLLEKSLKNDYSDFFLHPNGFHWLSKLNSYLMLIFRLDPVNPSALNFPISVLQKQWWIYLLFEKSLKNDCNNLYFHPYTLNMSYKPFSYLTSFSHSGPVNLSTLLAISVWQKQRQFYFSLGNSIKNGWNDLSAS